MSKAYSQLLDSSSPTAATLEFIEPTADYTAIDIQPIASSTAAANPSSSPSNTLDEPIQETIVSVIYR
jgi:hypothetical protein